MRCLANDFVAMVNIGVLTDTLFPNLTVTLWMLLLRKRSDDFPLTLFDLAPCVKTLAFLSF